MNITEKRYIPQELYPFIKLLKIGTSPIKLLGSAGLASQRYYSDYDLLTSIKMSCEGFYNSLKSVLETNCEIIENKCINKTTGKTIKACVPMHTFGHLHCANLLLDLS